MFLRLTEGSANIVVHGNVMKAAFAPHGVDARDVENGVMTRRNAPPGLSGQQWKFHATGAALAIIWKTTVI